MLTRSTSSPAGSQSKVPHATCSFKGKISNPASFRTAAYLTEHVNNHGTDDTSLQQYAIFSDAFSKS